MKLTYSEKSLTLNILDPINILIKNCKYRERKGHSNVPSIKHRKHIIQELGRRTKSKAKGFQSFMKHAQEICSQNHHTRNIHSNLISNRK
jgi:hypothetical protein